MACRIQTFVALLALAAVTVPGAARAQAVQPREAWDDAKAYATAPLRWDGRDWATFGATVLALGAAHTVDDDVREHFVGDVATTPADTHGSQDAAPAAVLLAGTWLLAAAVDDPGGWRELGSMLEASTLTAVSTEVLKFTFGRARPDETDDPDQWFESGDSFPSMHSSLAFAIGTVFAESGQQRWRWLRRTLGYGVAGYTAYARLDHNAHWTTDVLAGAALGWSTARFTINRREGTPQRGTLLVAPVDGGGVMLTYTAPLR